jgi:hypothetical protein
MGTPRRTAPWSLERAVHARGGKAMSDARTCAHQGRAGDALHRPLLRRSRFQQQLKAGVDMICMATDCAKSLQTWRNHCVNHHTF